VVWIHSTTGETRIFNEQAENELLDDPELEFLNGLPDPNVLVETNKPESLARAWFAKWTTAPPGAPRSLGGLRQSPSFSRLRRLSSAEPDLGRTK